jgi:dual specificity MAP kinase phosphatase
MFEFSNITDDLFIGITPLVTDYNGLRELGIKLLINMRLMHGPFPDDHPEPIKLLWLRTFDSPLFPIPVSKLMKGAKAALEMIEAGGKVYVHCAGGRHRGVAMGSCILIAQGYAPEAAIKLIAERRLVADPNAYYIRSQIMQFAHQWNNS